MREIIINGKKYQSLRKACLDNNLSYSLIHYRLEKLNDVNKALDLSYKIPRKPRSIQGNGKEIVVQGKTYASISEACRAFNVKNTTIFNRLSMGYTPDQAFDEDFKRKYDKRVEDRKHKSERIPVCIGGIEYKNIREYCIKKDLLGYYSQILTRHRRGESVEDIVNDLHKNKTCHKNIVYKGKSYKSSKEFCEKNGIEKQYSSFLNYINSGMSIKEAYKKALEIKKYEEEARVISGLG